MALSLNPLDLWKLVSDRRKADKEKIAVWIDQTAMEARKLADAWKKEMEKYEDEIHAAVDQQRMHANEPWGATFKMSYHSASAVFEGRIDQRWRDAFAQLSGAILKKREEVMRLHKELQKPKIDLPYQREPQRETDLLTFLGQCGNWTEKSPH